MKETGQRLISALIAAVGYGLTAVTLLAFGGRFWTLDLMSHFRVQYVLALAVTLIALWFARLPRLHLAGPLAALLINLSLIAPYWMPPVAASPTDGRALRLLAVNVQVGAGNEEAVVKLIETTTADIVVISELTPPLAARLAALGDQYPHQLLDPYSSGGYFGIGLLSRVEWESAAMIPLIRPDIPAIRAEIVVAGTAVTIWAAHTVPPLNPYAHELRGAQMGWLAQQIQAEETAVILMGDLNVSPFSRDFRLLAQETGLRDTARGRGLPPTWRSSRYPWGIAIDHVMVSSEFQVVSHAVGPDIDSDHWPLIVDLILRDGRQ
jgi:endonuclease/exonuclease/phosphatase (EEP) superfamily protein YafD